ncbi:hypothetical protein AB0442_28590 [Kitasatospora sp. NPDC085895]|uniref:hypothetical protein n=1 Tax=Kitasatospora sp. NPDC085895 TaxID=3155057 RepID=UPI00344BB5D0
MTAASSVPTTDARALNAAEMVQMAVASQDPLRRAQILADAQAQLAWALRSAVGECVEDKRSWSEIGQAIGLSKESAWRQWSSQGPVVSIRAGQSKDSANAKATDVQPAAAIYAVQAENGEWFGLHNALPEGDYKTGFLRLDAPNRESNRFASQTLRARYGPWAGDIPFFSCTVVDPDGTELKVRVTDEILNVIFGDGQTALRRALTALVHATLYSPDVDPDFRRLVDQAAHLQARSTPTAAQTGHDTRTTAEFVQAVNDVLTAGERSRPSNPHIESALRYLTNVVWEYQTWARAADHD